MSGNPSISSARIVEGTVAVRCPDPIDNFSAVNLGYLIEAMNTQHIVQDFRGANIANGIGAVWLGSGVVDPIANDPHRALMVANHNGVCKGFRFSAENTTWTLSLYHNGIITGVVYGPTAASAGSNFNGNIVLVPGDTIAVAVTNGGGAAANISVVTEFEWERTPLG